MYFEISRKKLLTPLKMIIGVVEQRQTLPILANTLTCVKDNTLHLTATDAEVEIACRLPLESGGGLNTDNDGEITIPARKFFDICKSLPDGAMIQIDTTDENQAVLKAGKSKFKLQTLPAEDFPNTPKLTEPTEFQISQHHLKNLLYKTSFCIAVKDGHRMAVAQHDFESEQEAKVIIPRKAVLELSKLLTDDDDANIKVTFDDNHIRFNGSTG